MKKLFGFFKKEKPLSLEEFQIQEKLQQEVNKVEKAKHTRAKPNYSYTKNFPEAKTIVNKYYSDLSDKAKLRMQYQLIKTKEEIEQGKIYTPEQNDDDYNFNFLSSLKTSYSF